MARKTSEGPTHPRLHIRHVHDAQKLLEAVRSGVLRRVTRRLNEIERHEYIGSGSVFVWEESDDEHGLRRWTDGKAFGQSRMRGDFLFYEEKIEGGSTPPRSPTTMWSSSVMRAEQGYPFAPSQDQSPHALIKQTYSAFFTCPQEKRQRKWHMTAYFTYADLSSLPTVDMDPLLRSTRVPQSLYRSGKARSRPSLDTEVCPPHAGYNPPQYQGWVASRPLLAPNSRDVSLTPSPPQSPKSLPSLNALLTSMPVSGHSGSRIAEDQRLIRLLNSNTFL